MRQRTLLIIGVGAITASLLLGIVGVATGILGGRGGDIGLDRAVQIAQQTAATYPGGGLRADEVIEFSQNYYASIRETATDIGAFEVLIDRSTGSVTREPGPDMMWNTEYSMMGGGMMAGRRVSQADSMTAPEAQAVAQSWLDSNRLGAKANAPDPFHGYYTIDFTSSGKIAGMLSVNAYSGQVWFHSWHGTFVQMRDLGA